MKKFNYFRSPVKIITEQKIVLFNYLRTCCFSLFLILCGFSQSQAQTNYFYVGGNAGTADFISATAWSLTLGGAAVTPTVSTTSVFIIDGSDVSITAVRNIGQLIIRNNNIPFH